MSKMVPRLSDRLNLIAAIGPVKVGGPPRGLGTIKVGLYLVSAEYRTAY